MTERQNQLNLARQLVRNGLNLIKLGNFLEALHKFEDAASIFLKQDAQEELSTLKPAIELTRVALGPWANYQYRIGRELLDSDAMEKVKEAKLRFELAVNACKLLKGEYSIGVAWAEFLIGLCLLRLDKFAEAIPHFNSAETEFEKINETQNATDCKTNIAYCLLRLGKDTEAKNYYEEAIETYQKLPICAEMADANVGLGRVLISLGTPEEALKCFAIAEPIFRKLLKWKKIGDININIGNSMLNRDQLQEAIEYYVKAKEYYAKVDETVEIARAEMNIGRALCRMGRYIEAIISLNAALSVFEEFGYISEMSLVHGTLGISYFFMWNLEIARSEFEACSRLREVVRLGVKSPELQRSLFKEFAELPDYLVAVNLGLWEKYRDSKYLDAALNELELAKCDTVAEALQINGVEPVSTPDIKKRLIEEEDKLLNIAAQHIKKLEEIAQLRRRNEITPEESRASTKEWEAEYNKIHEKLEDLRLEVMVKCADIGNTPVPRSYNVLKETLEVFPKKTKWAVLEFALLTAVNKLVVFLIQKDGSIKWKHHPASIEYVHNLVEKCKNVFTKIRNEEEYEANKMLDELSTDLYSALIPETIAKTLKTLEIDNLIVIPHRFLHWVPFEILFDSEEFWGLKYAISTAFSLDLVRLSVQRRETATRSEESPLFLFVKNPLLDLKLSDLEVDRIKDLLKKKKIKFSRRRLEHEKATQKAVFDALNTESFDVFHYAGHAAFMGKDPLKSSLWLHTNGDCPACNKKSTFHTQDLLNVQEIIHGVKFKRTPIIFMSACESGGAEVEEGDEMFGLARALIYAGATSLILSHWIIRGKIALPFSEEFYNQLLQGEPIAAALRKARQLVKSDPQFSLSDWGLFFLHGDPFRTFSKNEQAS